jgi:hypothetical protein
LLFQSSLAAELLVEELDGGQFVGKDKGIIVWGYFEGFGLVGCGYEDGDVSEERRLQGPGDEVGVVVVRGWVPI